jgi:preprotein translocase subunit SecB
MAEAEGINQTDGKKVINPLKIYLKDVSFESPYDQSRLASQWDPTLAVELDNGATELADDVYDVTLKITATATIGEATAFLVEVQQGGIFRIKGFEPDALRQRLNVYCLTALYPYACATMDDLVVKGGFPPLRLTPVNFLVRYKNALARSNPPPANEDADNEEADQ